MTGQRVIDGDSVVGCGVEYKVDSPDELLGCFRPRLKRRDQLVALVRGGSRGKRDVPRFNLAVQSGPRHLDDGAPGQTCRATGEPARQPCARLFLRVRFFQRGTNLVEDSAQEVLRVYE